MSIVQFLRIFWARRLIIVAATVACLIGAIIVGLSMPPRWEAHSRVLLNLVKPDPITGQAINPNASRGYVATQIAIIKDPAVAGQVADELGWLSDPVLIQQYQKRAKNDSRDFRRWISQRVIDNTKSSIVMADQGGPSNILDIGYTATEPNNARLVADALRKAFIDESLAFARQDAGRNADWFASQSQQAKVALDAAEAAKTDYERQNGIFLQDNKLDVDSARLQSLAGQGAVPTAPAIAAAQGPDSGLSLQLAQVDAALTQDAKVLGPNHPELQELRARRAALATQLAQQRAGGGRAASADIGALDRAVSAQKAKVIGEGDKLGRLRQLQAEVDLRRNLYDKTTALAAEYHQQTGVTDVGLTPLAGAVTPSSPAFPNWPLILMGSLGLGLAMGLLTALLIELFGRRVRGPEDLESFVDVPLLAIVGAPQTPTRRRAPVGWRPGARRSDKADPRKAVRA